MSLQRLRTDFQFAVLVACCVIGTLGILPFIVLRIAAHEWAAAAVDASIVAALVLAFVRGWRGGNVTRIGRFVVVVITLACVASSHLLGLSGAFWSFPVLLANFILVRRRDALLASVALISTVVIDGRAFVTVLDRSMYVASASVGCALAYVFALRTDVQREQLQTLASRDPLTGVANRRAMDREMHIAVEAFRRHRMPVGLLVMDLDHFKRINDEFGHEAGDDVLVHFTRVVQSSCRAGDRLFRYGGEEFVLLVPGIDADTLRRLAEVLREAVSVRVRAGTRAVTVSIGGAVLQPDEDSGAWIARADAAMYEPKREGRDRVVV
ncbi:GGDEF domain-containing protein [Lysobacter sp. TY2-98]|uniref:GGDEF domain-containing protein n=1 Tax=Lysobacter sp. TY2-98 TaxID=2290922 RepID=UPI000E203CD8|nr:GGDEF domain-containing protein [Lysobacter sp. TY2-98]AXK73356.1 GGDEF domain-containing protein [Lysobacter sp. TY2-98]